MIGIIDYGLGNIRAFENIYRQAKIPHCRVSEPVALEQVDRVILPGVGAFDSAMKKLNASGLRQKLDEKVAEGQLPVLGVCVGMQMMADCSDEGTEQGLGWIPGKVRRFPNQLEGQDVYLPHMGWNDVTPVSAHPLFGQLESGARFYFLHSFYFVPDDDTFRRAVTSYHIDFAAAVSKGNALGVQFHPEKSHGWGRQLLTNFARA